ncbi:AAA family ATPase [Acetivibrio straminisolvens]|uniref:AAA family ATPase n=1 Tax=Acetivibrio straminisolvens TaxID=253314 RepID=UPI00223FDE5D|nr:MoxR family ATPase [Acetivibrio straminisolvens]
MELNQIKDLMQRVKENIRKVIVGKDEIIDLLQIALISSGHVLLEDVPGTGKTLIAKAMAKSLDTSFKRIQFTPDLLPSDLSGINFFNQKESRFEFRPGPIFSNILLADEINRATPRTQSSLLECMEERQVTVDGETRMLKRPFMVVATQNPIDIQGTFPLPEAQLDRFLIKIRMGYPKTQESVEILKRFKEENPLDKIEPVASEKEIIDAQKSYSKVYVSDDILKYIVDIAEKTRNHKDVIIGVSPRGSQALLKAVQVYAILKGRGYVEPDDVKAMAKPVLCHRLVLKNAIMAKGQAEIIIDQILNEAVVPSEENLHKG